MSALLFLCTKNSARSQMAAAFAREFGPEEVKILSAGTHPAAALHPAAVAVMQEAGIDISGQTPAALGSLPLGDIEVAVTLCHAAAEECALLLPGQPIQVDWRLPDPVQTPGGPAAVLEAFRQTRDLLRRLVEEFFQRGYWDALRFSRQRADRILNSLSEGIIAHDLERRIFYFNRAAETITGYDRSEVLGRDCHEVFPPAFCGKDCSFCHSASPHFDRVVYPLEIRTRSGESREIEMSVQAIDDRDRRMAGVLASFRDLTREHDLARRLGEVQQFNGIIGRDKRMLEVFDLVRSVADAHVPVLVQGDSGTGKELVAAAIHHESRRSERLFVPVNCGALPEGLLESELFGHVRGAFTGAIHDKKGRFELAEGGTIFLDEIGDITTAMQVKLLRVLQEGTFERVGSAKTLRADVRVISATNKDLKAEIRAGRFREDLYYRLCVVPIHLPPLRERCGDIPLLVDHILARIARENNRDSLALAPAALDALLSYEWPGNVRELQNAMQFGLVKCRGSVIELAHLPPHILHGLDGRPRSVAALPRRSTRGRKAKLDTATVLQALHETHGNKVQAAHHLGVGRATLYRFLRQHPEADS